MQYIYWKLRQRNFRRIPTKFDKRGQNKSCRLNRKQKNAKIAFITQCISCCFFSENQVYYEYKVWGGQQTDFSKGV